ncbi:MAG TPA: ankyrin repeat domain-containing protein, partial [Acidimicrobiales bacterium]|nr:ankyrin repeat domain-containing protein [Acidimicrobiales bacterium]
MPEALFSAIDAGQVEDVRDLVLNDPALASARDTTGVSALLYTRYRNRLDVVEDHGQPVDQPELAHASAADGFTPLQLASFFGHPAAVRVLLDRGADVGAVSANPMHLQALHSA